MKVMGGLNNVLCACNVFVRIVPVLLCPCGVDFPSCQCARARRSRFLVMHRDLQVLINNPGVSHVVIEKILYN